MANFTMKQGDTLPDYQRQLLVGGVAYDLSALTTPHVYLIMRRAGFAEPVLNEEMAVVTPASGIVKYTWGTTDLATAGTYELEIEVRSSSGAKVITFPNTGYETLTVVDDIGDGA